MAYLTRFPAICRLLLAGSTGGNPVFGGSGNAKITPSYLRCAYLQNPLGIDIVTPPLSWQLRRETYQPRFTFFGFRYVEISAEPATPVIDAVRRCVVQSACETTGAFDSGDDLIKQIHQAAVWSQRSNMIGYPLDCPQRDERLSWLGDPQVTVEEAMLNMDMARFYENWLRRVEIPANTTADVYLPAGDVSRVFESGVPAQDSPGVSYHKSEAGRSLFSVASGADRFVVPNEGRLLK